MSTSSLLDTELRAQQTQRLQECIQRNGKLQNPHPYALGTALDLLGVPRPFSDRHPGNALCAVVSKNSEKHVLNGIKHIVWSVPFAITHCTGNVRATSPVDTWMMYAWRIPLEELIALGDAMMRRDNPLATLEEFEGALASETSRLEENSSRNAFRGFTKCKKALPLMRENTDSPMETKTRLALCDAGLPCPEVNFPLTAPGGHNFYLDMAYPDQKVAVEYDGSFHSKQLDEDVERRHQIEMLGWSVVQVTKGTLSNNANTQAMIELVRSKLTSSVKLSSATKLSSHT